MQEFQKLLREVIDQLDFELDGITLQGSTRVGGTDSYLYPHDLEDYSLGDTLQGFGEEIEQNMTLAIIRGLSRAQRRALQNEYRRAVCRENAPCSSRHWPALAEWQLVKLEGGFDLTRWGHRVAEALNNRAQVRGERKLPKTKRRR